MRKFWVILTVVLGLLLVFSACTAEMQEGQEEQTTQVPLKELAVEVENDTPPDDATTVTFSGVVLYVYKYYAYVVGEWGDDTNVGVKLYRPSSLDLDFRDIMTLGSSVTVTGKLYIRKYSEDAKELRIYVDSADDVVVGDTVDFPEPLELPAGSELTFDLFGSFVKVTGTYEGTDDHGNYLIDNSGATITIFKYSEVGSLEEGNEYTIKGVVGQNYGYVLFVATDTFVSSVE